MPFAAVMVAAKHRAVPFRASAPTILNAILTSYLQRKRLLPLPKVLLPITARLASIGRNRTIRAFMVEGALGTPWDAGASERDGKSRRAIKRM